MGWVREREYKLEFEDPQYAGLEVIATGISIDATILLAELGEREVNTQTENLAKVMQSTQMFLDHVVRWNWEYKDGTPVPITLAAVRAHDWDLANAMAKAWREATIGVTAPLGDGSNDGPPFPEESIPMEVSTESLPS